MKGFGIILKLNTRILEKIFLLPTLITKIVPIINTLFVHGLNYKSL